MYVQYHDLTARASPIKTLVSSSTRAKQHHNYSYDINGNSNSNGMLSPSATGARMWGADTSLSRKGSLSFADSMRLDITTMQMQCHVVLSCDV
jgi:hypothetical protein